MATIVRVSTWRIPSDPKARDTVRVYIARDVIPALQTVFGYQDGRWLLDEKNGSLVVVTNWGSEAALARSATLMGHVRQEGERRGLTFLTAESYEVLLEG